MPKPADDKVTWFFANTWEKVVFIGACIGLVVALGIQVHQYYVFDEIIENKEVLEEENDRLKEEKRVLEDSIEDLRGNWGQ